MSIKIKNPPIQPQITMNKLHVDKLVFDQTRDNISQRSIESIGVAYGLDVNGNKVFNSERMKVSTPNFDELAIADYMQKNPGATVMDAMAAYATAQATINAEVATNGIDTFTLMAWFEVAIGRIYELSGTAEIDTTV